LGSGACDAEGTLSIHSGQAPWLKHKINFLRWVFLSEPDAGFQEKEKATKKLALFRRNVYNFSFIGKYKLTQFFPSSEESRFRKTGSSRSLKSESRFLLFA